MLFVVVAVAMAVTMVLPALAAPGPHEGRDPTGKPADPDCWGAVSSDFAQVQDTQPGIGEHASFFPTPREGVANVSKHDSQEGDTPSDHGEAVGDCTAVPGAAP